MRHVVPPLFALVLLLPVTCAVAGDETLRLQTPAQYDIDAGVDPRVRAECQVDSRVSQKLAQQLEKTYRVVPVDVPLPGGGDKVLALTVLKVIGASGSVWTGKKGIVLQGTLTRNGETIGSFVAQRRSSGGTWGLFKDACYILDRCATALGKDVARWLERPAMDSWLGEMADD